MSEHPYRGLPPQQFWSSAVAGLEPFRVDPQVSTRFRIDREDRVATAGSCFAQHISRQLARIGFRYFVTEGGEGGEEAVFSARFGNIYTPRQLLQLFQECVQGRPVAEAAWSADDGRFVDALRPRIQPGGFDSPEQVLAERAVHRTAVRRMFAECDVFIFTLGLTEAWRSRIDGTVYPLAPGVAGGSYDAARHEFVNFDASTAGADLEEFLQGLRAINPRVRVVLTVSPVPLVATYEPRHVLVSTAYSKAVLRVIAEAAWRAHPWVDYFPSYEIITGSFNGGAYFQDDCRNVSPTGVGHAMRCFLAHYAGAGGEAPVAPAAVGGTEAWSDVSCDEEAMNRIRI